jgi:hypothetical protein
MSSQIIETCLVLCLADSVALLGIAGFDRILLAGSTGCGDLPCFRRFRMHRHIMLWLHPWTDQGCSMPAFVELSPNIKRAWAPGSRNINIHEDLPGHLPHFSNGVSQCTHQRWFLNLPAQKADRLL